MAKINDGNDLTRNTAILNNYSAGAGFSGVYGPSEDVYLLRPSGSTVLKDGSVPHGRVARAGGHITVNTDANLGINCIGWVSTHLTIGFTAVIDPAGELIVSTYSIGVNVPNYQTDEITDAKRNQLLTALQVSTGRQTRWVSIDDWRVMFPPTP